MCDSVSLISYLSLPAHFLFLYFKIPPLYTRSAEMGSYSLNLKLYGLTSYRLLNDAACWRGGSSATEHFPWKATTHYCKCSSCSVILRLIGTCQLGNCSLYHLNKKEEKKINCYKGHAVDVA